MIQRWKMITLSKEIRKQIDIKIPKWRTKLEPIQDKIAQIIESEEEEQTQFYLVAYIIAELICGYEEKKHQNNVTNAAKIFIELINKEEKKGTW